MAGTLGNWSPIRKQVSTAGTPRPCGSPWIRDSIDGSQPLALGQGVPKETQGLGEVGLLLEQTGTMPFFQLSDPLTRGGPDGRLAGSRAARTFGLSPSALRELAMSS